MHLTLVNKERNAICANRDSFGDLLRFRVISFASVKQVSNIFAVVLMSNLVCKAKCLTKGCQRNAYRHHLHQANHEIVTPRKRVPACNADILYALCVL